jgi:hypothetical protein
MAGSICRTAARSDHAEKSPAHTARPFHRTAGLAHHTADAPDRAAGCADHTRKPFCHTGKSFHRAAESFYRMVFGQKEAENAKNHLFYHPGGLCWSKRNISPQLLTSNS